MTAHDLVLVIGAVGGLITVIVSAIVNLRRAEAMKTEIKSDVKAVHEIVDQQHADMLAYQKTLIDALIARGIEIPENKPRR